MLRLSLTWNFAPVKGSLFPARRAFAQRQFRDPVRSGHARRTLFEGAAEALMLRSKFAVMKDSARVRRR